MPLDEREREELAKKINQQRRAMWKGQVTKERQTEKKRKGKKAKQSSEPQQKHEESEQIPVPRDQIVEEVPEEKIEKVEQPPEEIKEREKEELAKKIKQQRRAVWKGEPAAKVKRKKESRSTKRVLDYQREIEPTEQPAVPQMDKPSAKEKSRDYKSKVPTLKLALFVILGLIGAIAIGVTIGYLVAS